MRFSKRLCKVLDLLSPVTLLIDVGTDHAYLPIKAVSEKKVKKAIAIDNKKGPLSIATDHIEKTGLEHLIFPILSEGLKNISIASKEKDFLFDEESDGFEITKEKRVLLSPFLDFTIVIAGMGGENIISILSESLDVVFHAKEIILEPQKNIEKLKDYLSENSFELLSEDNIFSDGKYYSIFRVHKKRGTL